MPTRVTIFDRFNNPILNRVEFLWRESYNKYETTTFPIAVDFEGPNIRLVLTRVNDGEREHERAILIKPNGERIVEVMAKKGEEQISYESIFAHKDQAYIAKVEAEY